MGCELTAPIATETRTLPKTLLTTVGMTEKKPPLLMPLIITKAISGARLEETGHRHSILRAVTMRVVKREFSGPSLSDVKPVITRPTAEAKLKAATSAAPV
jgi:hypothetical protein